MLPILDKRDRICLRMGCLNRLRVVCMSRRVVNKSLCCFFSLIPWLCWWGTTSMRMLARLLWAFSAARWAVRSWPFWCNAQLHKDHIIGSILSAFMGLSVCWWKSDHNTHHIVCNAVEHDPNIQHMPMIAITDKIFKSHFGTRIIKNG